MQKLTIDGEPDSLNERELLAQWLGMFEGGIASSPLSALRELTRSLLNKPAEPSKLVGAAQYWSENEQALRDVCRFEGMKGLVYQVVRDRDGRSAKPKGKPVAWAWVDEKGEHGVTLRWDVAKHLPYFVKPLYAERPAPVATVELGKKEVGNYGALYDGPGVRRAYTYKHQPGNDAAHRIGVAAQATGLGGDAIDKGLKLLCELERAGLGVFEV